MRSAFGLPQALMIILIISGIVTVTMKYASINAQHYADSYTREQAELFMQSATEAALLRISSKNRSLSECANEFNITSSDGRFTAEINVTKYYLLGGKDNDGLTWNCGNDRNVSIDTPESHGMIDMNVIVTSLDPKTNPTKHLGNKVRLQRRSLQRP